MFPPIYIDIGVTLKTTIWQIPMACLEGNYNTCVFSWAVLWRNVNPTLVENNCLSTLVLYKYSYRKDALCKSLLNQQFI